MTTILLAVLCLSLITLLFFQQKSHVDTLSKLQEHQSGELKDWGTKALSRAEQSSNKAIAAITKTNDSLCRIFETQMSPVARETVDQPQLALGWEETIHPQELQEAIEEQMEQRRQLRQMGPTSGWTDRVAIPEQMTEHQNGKQDPVDHSLVDLGYDPSP